MKNRRWRVLLGILLASQLFLAFPIGVNGEVGPGTDGTGVRSDEPLFSDLGGADEPVYFTNVSEVAGLSEYSGSYFAWGDYDNDGYQDLLVNGRRLLRNGGPPRFTFTDVTSQVGLAGTTAVNVGIWGDYDNDGDLDVYLAGGGWTTSSPTRDDYLFRNDGSPDYTFTDVTAQAGSPVDDYPSTAAAWGDIDGDGFLDIYVANYENEAYNGYPDSLWHNEGDGTFTDASTSGGIRSSGSEPGRGVAFCDFDEDGDLDIHVSNYRIRPNFLWQNDGSGHFTNVAAQKGVTGDPSYYQSSGPYYGHTIGSSWADWNNDGHMDIWEANLVHKYVGGGDIRGYICDDSKFYRNNGPPSWNFTDVRDDTGIPTKPVGGASVYRGDELYDGIAWADFDNDGDLDVFMPQVYNLDYSYSYLYVNRGDGSFDDVGISLGLRVWNTYGAAWADYDKDGDLDLVTGGKSPMDAPSRIHLFQNSGNMNGWLRVEVEGTVSNSMGLGTRVTVTVGNTTMTRDFEGGTGSHAQMNDLPVEFGLGRADRVDSVVVEFPSGITMGYLDVDANTTLEVREVDTGGPLEISVQRSPAYEDEEVHMQTRAGAATSGPYTGYYWDLDGDGRFETRTEGYNIDASWTEQGVYAVRVAMAMSVEGQSFCVVSERTPVMVLNLAPSAMAGEDVTIGEEQVLVLNGSASNDTASDLPTLMYRWVVAGEDRGWSDDPTTNVSWPVDGKHLVQLYVLDDDGAVDSDDLWVTVVNLAPVMQRPEDVTVREDDPVEIHLTAEDAAGDMAGLRYRIEFGDGNGTGWMQDARRTYVYREAGVMVVRVQAKDGDGATSSVTFNVTVVNVEPTCMLDLEVAEVDEDEELTVYGQSMDTPSDLETLRWRFAFGDGNGTEWRNRPIQRTTHSYAGAGTYEVSLQVIDDDGATYSESGEVEVLNLAPRVEVTGPSTTMDEDEEAWLSLEATDTPSDKPGLQFRWDLGDGTIIDWSYQVEVEHGYPSAGTYVVEVRVRDDDGEEAFAQVPVKVVNRPPIAEGIQSATSVLEGEEVTFDAAGSRDTAGDMEDLVYEWTRGPEIRSGERVTFQFESEGSFTIILTVTDDDGAFNQLFFTVKVKNQVPSGVPTVDRTEAKLGKVFNFAALDLADTPNDLPNLTVSWSFGDGELGTGLTLAHRYDEAGDYTVTMTIRDDDGATYEGYLYITVTEDEGIISGKGATLAIVATLAAIVILAISYIVLRRESEEETPSVEEPVTATLEEDPYDNLDDGDSNEGDGPGPGHGSP